MARSDGSVQDKLTNVMLASIDPATGNPTNAPTRASERLEGSQGGSDWSADGTKLAWIAKREQRFVLSILEIPGCSASECQTT